MHCTNSVYSNGQASHKNCANKAKEAKKKKLNLMTLETFSLSGWKTFSCAA